MYWIIRTKSRECSLFPIIGTKDLSGRSRKPSKNVWRLVEMGWRKKRIWITELEEKIFYYHRLFQLTELSTPSFRILRGSILHCSLPLSLPSLFLGDSCETWLSNNYSMQKFKFLVSLEIRSNFFFAMKFRCSSPYHWVGRPIKSNPSLCN
jgi:hypothetical protein